MIEGLRFLWNATRGYRLQPWKSPFLRWRIETYSGIKADQLTRPLVLKFMWQHKLELFNFLRWTSEIKAHRRQGEPRRR